mmetsp:Transcript_9474/g.20493  ORF Transcript_9474/g.20493 Transcript_9474/m.20493 type:complete len:103 (+) Transcript_9474:78-386(+)
MLQHRNLVWLGKYKNVSSPCVSNAVVEVFSLFSPPQLLSFHQSESMEQSTKIRKRNESMKESVIQALFHILENTLREFIYYPRLVDNNGSIHLVQGLFRLLA